MRKCLGHQWKNTTEYSLQFWRNDCLSCMQSSSFTFEKNVYHCLLSYEYIFLLLIPKLTFACQRKQTYINILLCMHISLQNQNSLKKQTVCLQKEIGKENIRSGKTFLLRQFKIPLKPGRVNSQQDTYIIMSSFGLDAFMNVCTGVYCK